jgi:hypothetical protein
MIPACASLHVKPAIGNAANPSCHAVRMSVFPPDTFAAATDSWREPTFLVGIHDRPPEDEGAAFETDIRGKIGTGGEIGTKDRAKDRDRLKRHR